MVGHGTACRIRPGGYGIRAVLPCGAALASDAFARLADPFPLGARLYNARGERFMVSLPQGTENVTRDIRSRAISRKLLPAVASIMTP
jgi:hypothetical protein